ncbi:MAG TPA: TIR domain-containing protein [Pyrinomonadaceae bacterium]|nr:TIR domain-containing protein [Pyrinomonadaceae bacterium]
MEKEAQDIPTYHYDVCLSFAGEERSYVREVADALTENGVRVFFDEYEEARLWGKDLYVHLDTVYRNQALYCVLFISHSYANKLWTNHERQSAQARAFMENREYILPARFDDTVIPGLRDTVGYIDLRSKSPHELATIVLAKLNAGKDSEKLLRSQRPPSVTAFNEPSREEPGTYSSSIEKFAWTALDFITLRPRRFFQVRSFNAKQYTDPLPFAIGTLIIWQFAMMTIGKIGAQLWDWEYISGAEFPVRIEATVTNVLSLALISNIVVIALIPVCFKVGLWLVDRKASFKIILVAYSYATSIIYLMITYAGLALFVCVILKGIPNNNLNLNELGRSLYIGHVILNFVLCWVYLFPAISAMTFITVKRLFLGFILSLLTLSMILAIVVRFIAYLVYL